MKILKTGSTRIVLILNNCVIKIPSFHSLKNFLLGWVHNMNEIQWSKIEHHRLTNIRWSLLQGLIVCHEKLSDVRHYGLFRIDLCELVVTNRDISDNFWECDAKPNNFGYRGPTLVKLDYGD